MTISVKTFVVTPLQENCYVVWNDAGECVVIDPGGEAARLMQFLTENKLKPAYILNTHGHYDHIGANAEMRRLTGASIGVHPGDAAMLSSELLCGARWIGLPFEEHDPDFTFKEGEFIGTGDLQFEVFLTPGHSPGSCSFLHRAEGVLFDGDLVFRQAVGRWDLPGGDEKTLFSSIRTKFLTLPDNTKVYPGHGPSTTVGFERRTNPFLR